MNTIQEVEARLQTMVADAISRGSATAYFAALYLQMTRQVHKAMDQGQFQDAARMQQLDVNFALRYFQAWDQYHAGQPCTQCWQLAFDEAATDRVSVLQHLLLGINAHINTDLGIAAEQTSPGSSIQNLRADFDQINVVIRNLLGVVQQKLDRISWPLRFADRIAGNADTSVANFSIIMARDAAWKAATDLSVSPDKPAYIQALDQRTTALGRRIAHPGLLPNLLLVPAKWFEKGDVASRTNILLS